MAPSVNRAKVDKGKVGGMVGQVVDRGLGDPIIAIFILGEIAVEGCVHAQGLAQVAQRLPFVNPRTAQTSVFRHIYQAGHRARHWLPVVGGDTVAGRRDTVEDRHVTGQRD